MIDGLKPYPNYKPSPVLGLPSIPAQWSAPRLKTVFREVDRRSGTGQEPLLSLRMQLGLIDHHEAGGKLIRPTSLTHYKLAAPGELVMNRMRAAAGLFGVPPKLGLVSPDYAVLRPRSQVELQFFLNLFKTPVMMSAFRLESRGLGTGESGFLRLYTERFGMLAAPVPPPDEQAAIVRFLDHADRRIRRYVRAKQKLIKLLEEQKQAIIHQAVTRGLDPSVPMKDSGVTWLGSIPVHWERMALSRVTKSRCDGPFGSGLKSTHYRESGVRVVRLQNIGHGDFKGGAAAFISEQHYATLGNHSVVAGDLIVAGLGDDRHPAGRACVAPIDLGPAMVKADCFRFRLDLGRVDATFLALQLTATARTASAVLSRGATRERVNLQTTSGRTIALPSVLEQRNIAARVASETEPLHRAISATSSEIVLLRELRTRLIADVVTGQLDVRAAAAALPDERTADDEPLDDADETGDDDLDADAPSEDDDA